MKNTLVLGCGIGGIVASTVLKKAMGPNMEVTVIDKEDQHHYRSSYPLLMIGQRKPEAISKNLRNIEKKGVKFLHAEVTGLDLPRQLVITTKGVHEFNYLIISLGTEYHPETVPGFNRAYNIYEFNDVVKLREVLAHIKSGSVVLFISSIPYKCPPAPYEIMFLLDQYFKQRGIRNKVKLTLVTPDFTPEPLAGPLVGQSVRKMLAEKDIVLRTEAKVLSLEANELILDHGQRIQGDLFLGIAPHWTPEVLRHSDLVDSDGWVVVDQHTLETKYPGVYAIGDAAGIRLPVIGNLAPKAGIFAHYQAEVVARNIALIERNHLPNFRYTGKGA